MSVKSKILTSIERKTKVDYAYAEKALSNMKISDLLKVTSKEDFDSELTQKIVELQKEYLDLFKGRNYSLEEIQTYMCETFLEYKEEYEKIINDQKVEFSSYSLNKNTNISISPEQIKTLREQADKLSVQRGVMIAQCTIFSATAAAMYAISCNKINDLTNYSSVRTSKTIEYFASKEELLRDIDDIIQWLGIIDGVTTLVLTIASSFPPSLHQLLQHVLHCPLQVAHV